MPILSKGRDVFPENLFDFSLADAPWVVLHVRSRQEKVLARHLENHGAAFYLPQIQRLTKRGGREFVSHVPLFAGYVFMRGGARAKEAAWRSNVVANIIDVEDQARIHDELCQLRRLQLSGASLTPHLDLVPGTPVQVTDGAFAGYTGVVLKEKDGERLIVTISHLHRAIAIDLRRHAVMTHRADSVDRRRQS